MVSDKTIWLFAFGDSKLTQPNKLHDGIGKRKTGGQVCGHKHFEILWKWAWECFLNLWPEGMARAALVVLAPQPGVRGMLHTAYDTCGGMSKFWGFHRPWRLTATSAAACALQHYWHWEFSTCCLLKNGWKGDFRFDGMMPCIRYVQSTCGTRKVEEWPSNSA